MIIDAAELDAASAYKLLIGSVIPRAVAWVSTVSPEGVANLAPISFFTPVGRKPPMVSITLQPRSDGVTMKDTFVNIRDTGEFVTNLATLPQADAMHASAFEFDPGVDEFEALGLEKEPLTLAQDTAATDGTGPLAAGRMIVELGWVTAVLGLGEETVRAARDALAVLRSADDSHLTVLVRDTAAAARSLDAYGHALASGAEAGLERLAYLPADADQADEADVFGLTFRGMLNCLAGRVSVAASELSTVVRRSRPGTFQVLGLAGYVHLIVCHMLRGSWDRAETETETALSAVEAHGHAIDHAVLHSLAAALAAGRG
ncbi:flavin reductase family protein, partial [Streptomyces sp. NPDC005180]|uniref:flavin reductase family protein n=1 Tax=Streptomyces sp. NPDC005180 TaxID=3156868 RepID=UPI0033A1BC90